mgnify:CR=1 FL=1
MKDKFASAGLAIMLISACCMDSEDLTIPAAMMIISIFMLGIVAIIEWREERAKQHRKEN